jgi:hypothetical protein
MAETLTVSNVAHGLLTEMLRVTTLPSPVINFAQPAGAATVEGLVLGDALQDYLEAFVVAGCEVPQDSILEVRGIRFSFAPEWQRVIKGWTLGVRTDGSFELKDAEVRISRKAGQRFTA